MANVSIGRNTCLVFAVAAILSSFGPGCAAPVLPLPPPTALVEAPPDMDGIVTIRGEAQPGAFVGCLNENTEAGVIVRADPMSGEYTVRIAAMTGDGVALWQFQGTDSGGMRRDLIIP